MSTSDDIEIRKLDPKTVFNLTNILEMDSGWKTLMSIIPLDCFDDQTATLKYTSEDIRLIEEAGEKQGRACSEIFLEEWGTSGKRRATNRVLLNCLVKAGLFRAADFVAANILGEPIPKRPESGPEAEVKLEEEEVICSDVCEMASSAMSTIVTARSEKSFEILNENVSSIAFRETDLCDKYVADSSETIIEKTKEGLPVIAYDALLRATNGFDSKLGSGGFGSVFFGKLKDVEVAVKVLNVVQGYDVWKHFKSECEIISRCSHENVLSLLGVSYDKIPCMVYEYMPNGSVLDWLQSKQDTFLVWRRRLDICWDVANGLHYLHSYKGNPIIHRDIKSSNILLNESMVAKIGDFGLVRENDYGMTMFDSTVSGTNAYMPPEAFRGVISTKMDIYSFGVVMLELLTALPAYDENRPEGDLVTFFENNEEEADRFWDEKAAWPPFVSSKFHDVARECLMVDKRRRPDAGELMAILGRLKEETAGRDFFE